MFKKDKNEVRVFFDFYYTELDAFAEYLEKQEENGFRLKEISGHSLYFEKCEPRKIRYTAEIFKGSTPEEFVESCRQEGWEYVDVYNGELYIFRTKQAYIIDIMTDEKEKMKTVGKRVLSQPGSLAGLGITILHLINYALRVNLGIGITLFETNVYNYTMLMLIVLFSGSFFHRVIDYFLWKFKTESALRKGERSDFLNLKNTVVKRRVYAFAASLLFIVIILVSSWIDPEIFKYVWEVPVLAIPVIVIYRTLLLSVSPVYDKKKKLRNHVITGIAIIIVATGLFALREYNEAASIENRKSMLSLKEIPISLSDLGIEAKSYEDEGTVDATRFAQLYDFTSKAEWSDENENSSGLMWYYILVTDYPHIQQKYIDKIFKEYEERGSELIKVTPPETGWDYYYKENIEDDNIYYGFAVKDNMVLYLQFSVVMEERDFFELAYEKLFGKHTAEES